MSAPHLSRRRFLTGLSTSAGLLLVGASLSACTDADGDAARAARPAAPDPRVPTGDAVGYERLVLHAGPRGQVERDWRDHHSFELVRPDGTVVRHGNGDHAQLSTAHDAALAADGTLWVSDVGNRRLVHLGPDLEVLGAVTAIAGQQLLRPKGLTAVGDRIAVTDTGLGRVAVVDTDGDGTWIGTPLESHPRMRTGSLLWDEAEPGVLDHPTAVAATADGRLVVFDANAPRLTTFDVDGKATATIALTGRPSDFAMDPAGPMYLADVRRRLVYRVTDDGSETPVTVFDRDGEVEISSTQAATWQPYRLTWRRGTTDDVNGLVVSLLPAIPAR